MKEQKSVLIVEDIRVVRERIQKILTDAYFRVLGTAVHGVEAVEKALTLKPDCITMDLVLPKLNGIEATKQILKVLPDTLIVMVTALPQENLVTEAIVAGAQDYVLKPFRAADLVRTLEYVFEKYEKGKSRQL